MNSRRKVRTEELIIRLLERLLMKVAIMLSIAAVIILIWGEYNVAKADAMVDLYIISPERISVEESMRWYINSLPIPEEEVLDDEVESSKEYSEEAYMNYTEEDLYLLAQAMYAEEGVFFRELEEEPTKVEKVHKLCGSVILRRLENNYRDCKTIEEVIFCEGQYAEQTQQRVREGQDIPEIVYKWAEELLTEGPIGPKGLIYQSEFEQGEKYDEIGNQKFGINPNYN